MHFYPPQAAARSLLVGTRIRYPPLRFDASPDFFVSIGLTVVVVVAATVTLCLVAQTTGWISSISMPVMTVVILLAALVLIALWATVLGDPGLVTELPDDVQGVDVVEVKDFLQRPEMSDHDTCACRVCGVLVRGFDHHCGVIGACIGERNMWSFILFLSSTAVLCLIGAIVHTLMLYAAFPSHVRELEHLKPMVSLRVALSGACSLLCVYGGSYCFILSIVYTSYVCQGQDSWGKRWAPRYDGRSKWRRFVEAFRWAKEWRSSFATRHSLFDLIV